MAKQIRFKESTVQITKSGIRQVGSMLKVLEFKIDADAEIVKTRFVGEKRTSPDLDVQGYGFSFQNQIRDRRWFTLWNEIQVAEEQGLELPELSIAVTDAYRDGSNLTLVLHGEMVMKMDSSEIPTGGYRTVSWSGYCQFCNGI
jgi:hypothetical protein